MPLPRISPGDSSVGSVILPPTTIVALPSMTMKISVSATCTSDLPGLSRRVAMTLYSALVMIALPVSPEARASSTSAGLKYSTLAGVSAAMTATAAKGSQARARMRCDINFSSLDFANTGMTSACSARRRVLCARNAELLHPVTQRRGLHAQPQRGTGIPLDDPARGIEHAQDVFALHGMQAGVERLVQIDGASERVARAGGVDRGRGDQRGTLGRR